MPIPLASRFRPMPSIHAEFDCLRKCGEHDLSGVSMLILRISKTGEFQNSKPCHHCTQMLKKKGIRRVIYSNEEGSLTRESVDDLADPTLSQGWRRLQTKSTST